MRGCGLGGGVLIDGVNYHTCAAAADHAILHSSSSKWTSLFHVVPRTGYVRTYSGKSRRFRHLGTLSIS